MKTITSEYFHEKTGHPPTNDDLERANCPDQGKVGHTNCGWCSFCDMPRTACALFTKDTVTVLPFGLEDAIEVIEVTVKEFVEQYNLECDGDPFIGGSTPKFLTIGIYHATPKAAIMLINHLREEKISLILVRMIMRAVLRYLEDHLGDEIDSAQLLELTRTVLKLIDRRENDE